MKHILMLMAAMLCGCGVNSLDPEEVVNAMVPPVVIIAKSSDGTVVVRDKNGLVKMMNPEFYFTKAIAKTMNIGDAIRMEVGK